MMTEVRLLEQFFRVFDDFLDAVMIINDQKEILYLNTSGENLFHLRLKRILSKKSYECVTFSLDHLFCMPDGVTGKESPSQYFEVDFTTPKDIKGKVQIMITPVSLEGLPEMWLIYFHNVTDEINLSSAYITESKEKAKASGELFKIQGDLKEYSEMALKDQMTGLGNYRYFEQQMVKTLNNIALENKPIGLVIMDVDKFKVFNDTYGHQQGDEVLRHVGKCLTHSVRATDVVARYGGEEFVMILNNCHLEGLKVVCEKVRKSIEETMVPYLKMPGEFLHVTLSLGGITIDPEMLMASGINDFKTLLEEADKNLYEAKHTGRNRFVTSTWKLKKLD
jgi:diguanylate cyclase (GGDEF)-like protein